jgi:hypothetical protein
MHGCSTPNEESNMFNIMQRTAIVLTSALFLLTSACTTIKPVYETPEQSFETQIEIGEKVRITYIDDITRDIFVTEVTAKEIKGTLAKSNKVLPKGAEVVADWKDVYAVETVKISAIKTVGAGLGIIIAIPLIAVGGVFAVAAGA